MRNNYLALLIHVIIGVLTSILCNNMLNKSSSWGLIAVIFIALVLYLVLGYLLSRLDFFDLECKKIKHVILPSIVLLITSALSGIFIVFPNMEVSFLSGLTETAVKIFGQPVEAFMTTTPGEMNVPLITLDIILCAMPSLLIWLGLLAGSKVGEDIEKQEKEIVYK